MWDSGGTQILLDGKKFELYALTAVADLHSKILDPPRVQIFGEIWQNPMLAQPTRRDDAPTSRNILDPLLHKQWWHKNIPIFPSSRVLAPAPSTSHLVKLSLRSIYCCIQFLRNLPKKFCLCLLILESLTRIGDWHEYLSEYTAVYGLSLSLVLIGWCCYSDHFPIHHCWRIQCLIPQYHGENVTWLEVNQVQSHYVLLFPWARGHWIDSWRLEKKTLWRR